MNVFPWPRLPAESSQEGGWLQESDALLSIMNLLSGSRKWVLWQLSVPPPPISNNSFFPIYFPLVI